MYSVYFETRRNTIQTVGSGKNFNLCMALIDAFLKEHKFKSYYKRFYDVDKDNYKVSGRVTCVDVGSHVECFYIKPAIEIPNGEV